MECTLLIGGLWRVGAICRAGKHYSWFEEFLNELGSNLDPEKERLYTMLAETARNGTEELPTERLKSLGDSLFEFRTRRLRVFFFKDEGDRKSVV